MSKSTPERRMQAHAELTQSIAAAVVAALAVLSPADVAAVLTRAAELLESEE